MAFTVITFAAGETTVEVMTKADLKTKLDAGAYGASPAFFTSLTGIPIKPANWAGKVLIIQGDIAVPTPQTVITKWTLPTTTAVSAEEAVKG